jgi:hypothetical protein
VHNQTLSAEQGFRVMFLFLGQYYNRVGSMGDLSAVLSDLQMMPDGRPADPAAWEDWLKAVRTVIEDAAN